MTAYFSLIETEMIRNGVDPDPEILALLEASPDMDRRLASDAAVHEALIQLENR